MKIIDISWPLDANTPVKPGEEKLIAEPTKTFSKDESREHVISISAHSGTHIDAPAGFFRDGKSIDQLDLNLFTGPANVVDLTEVEGSIKEEDLQTQDIREGDIILLKTKNSNLADTAAYSSSFVYLDITAANYLVKKKIKTVGFDYITLEPESNQECAHKQLLQHEIAIMEGLRLGHAMPGIYFFFCLPLYTLGIEAAPARAILIDVNEDIERDYQNK